MGAVFAGGCLTFIIHARQKLGYFTIALHIYDQTSLWNFYFGCVILLARLAKFGRM